MYRCLRFFKFFMKIKRRQTSVKIDQSYIWNNNYLTFISSLVTVIISFFLSVHLTTTTKCVIIK